MLFIENGGSFPDSELGHYQREGVLWQNENLDNEARRYVQTYTVIRGAPNMTAASFCSWVNGTLLPRSTLEPGYPRKTSVQSARKWLHDLGFFIMDTKKGVHYEGHEREDVIESRRKFLWKMVAVGFLNPDNAPTEEAKCSLPADLEAPPLERQKKNDQAKTVYPNIKLQARSCHEYGEARDGYWTSDTFMKQVQDATLIAEVKYACDKGYRLVWVFEHSGCQTAYADNVIK